MARKKFGTALGKLTNAKAQSEGRKGVLQGLTGGLLSLGNSVSSGSGNAAGGVGAELGKGAAKGGFARAEAAMQTIQRAHAREGLVAKARGGSAALGQHGVVPAKPADSGDTFERHRTDARSGKPITETVRKRAK